MKSSKNLSYILTVQLCAKWPYIFFLLRVGASCLSYARRRLPFLNLNVLFQADSPHLKAKRSGRQKKKYSCLGCVYVRVCVCGGGETRCVAISVIVLSSLTLMSLGRGFSCTFHSHWCRRGWSLVAFLKPPLILLFLTPKCLHHSLCSHIVWRRRNWFCH